MHGQRRHLVGLAIAAAVALAPLVPVAGVAVASAQASTITGTLAAVPQGALPTVLLLQVGGQTLMVTVGAGTSLVNGANQALALGQLQAGDTLQVDGLANQSGGLDATLVVDLSTATATTTTSTAAVQVSGTLASVPATGLLCLQNAAVSNGAVVGAGGACPIGQTPIYFGSATGFFGPTGGTTSAGNLNLGDTLTVIGVLSGGQVIATTIQDLSTAAATAPTNTMQVQGVLAATAPGLLCLSGTSVTAGVIGLVDLASACPSGLLPVYVGNAATFLGSSSPSIGDTMLVSGFDVGATFTAYVLQDLTALSATPATVTTGSAPVAGAPAPTGSDTITVTGGQNTITGTGQDTITVTGQAPPATVTQTTAGAGSQTTVTTVTATTPVTPTTTVAPALPDGKGGLTPS